MNNYTITITRNGSVHESIEAQASTEDLVLRGAQLSREARNIHRAGDCYSVQTREPAQADGHALAVASMYSLSEGFAAHVDAIAGLRSP